MAEKTPIKKDGNHSFGNHIRNVFGLPKTEDPTSREQNQPSRRLEQQYTANGGGSNVDGSQTQTLTLTDQIQQHLPTLIFKLKESHKENLKGKSEKEQEEYVNQQIQSFREMLLRNIDEFHAIVRSARPSPDAVNDRDYQEQKEAYCELLKAAMALVSLMQATINKVLTDYRLFIEELWDTICAGRDPNPIAVRFQQQTDAYIKQSWDPVFAQANKMMEEIEKSRKPPTDKK